MESLFKPNDIYSILDKEFDKLINRILEAKLEWISKFQAKFEELLYIYPKIHQEKIDAINAKCNEELAELEENMNPSNFSELNKFYRY